MTARRPDERYSRDYLDPAKRSIANAVQVYFTDGTHTDKVEVEYPLGHRRRRAQGVPLLKEKFAINLATRFDAQRSATMQALFEDAGRLDTIGVRDFVGLFV
jgi:2-methylcitrate dehydratase